MKRIALKSFFTIVLMCFSFSTRAQSIDYTELGEKAKVSADSVDALLARFMQREQTLRASNRVEAAVLQTLLSLQTTDSLSHIYHDLALSDLDLLAQARAKDHSTLVKRMPMGKYFHDDMLSVIGYELGEYKLLHDYYERHGNREASLLCALESLRLRPDRESRQTAGSTYLHTLDSLMAVYGDLDLAAELAIERYTFMEKARDVSDTEKQSFLKTNIDKYRRYKRIAQLVNAYGQLTQPSTRIEAPSYLYTSQDTIQLLYQHKNVNEATLSIYRTNITNRDLTEDRNSGLIYSTYREVDGKTFKKLKRKYSLSEVKSQRQELTQTNDSMLALVSQTVSVGPLPVGIYILEVKPKTSPASEPLRHLLMVSDVRALITALPNDSCLITAVDAISGEPLKNAFFMEEDEEPVAMDERGNIMVDDMLDGLVFTEGDTALPLFSLGELSHFDSTGDDAEQIVAELMTDRSIYRPGQTVHLALVAYQKKGCDIHAIRGQTFVISLENPQRREVDSLVVTTDDFGTAHINHQLSQMSPLGNYHFTTSEKRSRLKYNLAGRPECTIKVEEYKRPTFRVTIDDNHDLVRIGDTLHLKGRAISITGEPLRQATVAWSAQIKSMRDWQRMLRTVADTLATDAQGQFILHLPISSRNPYLTRKDDVFMTEIHANVTDDKGESHDVEKHFHFTEKGLRLHSNVDGKIFERADLQDFSFFVSATNFCGKEVQVPIHHLLDGKPGDSCVFKAPHLPTGSHVLTLIHEGDTLQQHFTVYDRQDTRPCVVTDNWFDTSGKTFDQSGRQPCSVWIGSSAHDVNIFYSVFNADSLLQRGQLHLSDSIVRQDFHYREEYGDGITILYSWYKDGILFYDEAKFEVPKPDKRLTAQWSTFRDQLVPGTEETWRLRLTHPDGQPADARMIATLYDQSLDELYPHRWSWHPQLTHRMADIDVYQPRKYLHTFEIPKLKRQPVEELQMSWLNFGVGNMGMSVPVSGRVCDATGEPLIGVSVMLAGSRGGTVTDLDGHYSLMAPAGGQLTFAYIGYTTKRLRVIAQTLNVMMEDDSAALDEVVVVGYGVSKKSFMTGRVNGVAVDNNTSIRVRGTASVDEDSSPIYVVDGVVVEGQPDIPASSIISMEVLKGSDAVGIYGARAAAGVVVITTNQHPLATSPAGQPTPLSVAMRENLSETAFFYPTLRTDANGEIRIDFTLPESVTSWRFLGSAHTREMDHTIIEASTVARKELMVLPNMPRFLRTNDKGTISSRVSNTSGKTLRGTGTLQLVDPETDRIVYTVSQPFSVKADSTATLSFCYTPGEQTPTLLACKVGVSADGMSDGEQHYLPILPATEPQMRTLPFTLHTSQRTTLNAKALFPKGSGDRRLILEYTNHPAWLLIQALHEYAHPVDECSICQAMALFSQKVSTTLLDQPEVKGVVEKWGAEKDSTKTLLSSLKRNDELKNILLEETPWMVAADKETDQKHQLVELLDHTAMNKKQNKALAALITMQHDDGSWSWFPGMSGSSLITRSVAELLVRRNVLCGKQPDTQIMLDKAFDFIARDGAGLHYLYLCALDGRNPADSLRREVKRELKALRRDAKNNDITDIYLAAVKAIVLNAFHEKGADQLLDQILALTVHHPERGRYFDSYLAPYSWCDYKIPTQVMVIEALQRIRPTDRQTIDEMRQWLLQEKRTQYWVTSIQSANAIYAYLNGNMESLSATDMPRIDINGQSLDTSSATSVLGYLKTCVDQEQIGDVSIDKQGKQTAWGALYALYTQRSSEVKASGSDLTVKREIIASHKGQLRVGDKVRVRITLTAARDLDFVQVNDRRAACLEPVEALSGYSYGCYVNNRDCTTQYFITKLSKGTHVLEKEYFVDREGSYRSGTITAQCAYAPEYSAIGEDYGLVVNAHLMSPK